MSPDKTPRRPYALDQLYRDQSREWVKHCIAPTIAWLCGSASRPKASYRFVVQHGADETPTSQTEVTLSWNMSQLRKEDAGLDEDIDLYRTGRTPHREHMVECAAYGLALVAISLFLPGRRVIWMQKGMAPDMLFDLTPDALRGVEVAGRTHGGAAALRAVRLGTKDEKGKAGHLRARPDISEAYLSLWSVSPNMSEMWRAVP